MELADPAWRDRRLWRETLATQDLAEAVMGEGFAGLLVPSFARGAPLEALCLVLWRWKGL